LTDQSVRIAPEVTAVRQKPLFTFTLFAVVLAV
jgi:hypothetical protein